MTFKPPIPKEHGSWAMLIVPLLLGLLISPTWHWRALILVIASFSFFLVRFPLATLVKKRRSTRVDRRYLWQWVAIYGGFTILSGGWLILGENLWWLAVIGVGGVMLLGFHLWLVWHKKEMSAVGELAGILGLALGAPMAYYAASGQLDNIAVILWVINALYFGGTVFYIKLKVRQQPRLSAPNGVGERLIKAKACLGYQTIVLTVIILLVTFQKAPLLTPLAFIPATIKAFHGAWQWQDKKTLSLMKLGIIEIVHSVIFTVLVVMAFI